MVNFITIHLANRISLINQYNHNMALDAHLVYMCLFSQHRRKRLTVNINNSFRIYKVMDSFVRLESGLLTEYLTRAAIRTSHRALWSDGSCSAPAASSWPGQRMRSARSCADGCRPIFWKFCTSFVKELAKMSFNRLPVWGVPDKFGPFRYISLNGLSKDYFYSNERLIHVV